MISCVQSIVPGTASFLRPTDCLDILDHSAQFGLLEKRVAQIIQISKGAGISSTGLAQVITTKWKAEGNF